MWSSATRRQPSLVKKKIQEKSNSNFATSHVNLGNTWTCFSSAGTKKLIRVEKNICESGETYLQKVVAVTAAKCFFY